MPFYLTRDPVPSADMRNVFDNAQNLDLALNDITSSFWSDRLGRSRMSWFGLESAFTVKLSDFESRFSTQIVEQETTFDASQADKENRFQAFLDSSGYVFLGDYEDGPFQFSARNQYIRYNDQYYRLNATTDVGFTTTGTDATSFANDVTHFVLMDGDTLRQNLGSSDGEKLIGKCPHVGALRSIEPSYSDQTITLLRVVPDGPVVNLQLSYDADDTTSADDGYSVFVTTGGARWKADTSEGIDVRWAGLNLAGTNLGSCLNKIIQGELAKIIAADDYMAGVTNIKIKAKNHPKHNKRFVLDETVNYPSFISIQPTDFMTAAVVRDIDGWVISNNIDGLPPSVTEFVNQQGTTVLAALSGRIETIGPGVSASTCSGVKFGNTSGGSTVLDLRDAVIKNINVRGFDKGVQLFGWDTYINTFEYCNIAGNNYNVYADGDKSNGGEKILFRSCVLGNASKSNVYWNTPLTDVTFDNTSIDYAQQHAFHFGPLGRGNQFRLTNGSHVEGFGGMLVYSDATTIPAVSQGYFLADASCRIDCAGVVQSAWAPRRQVIYDPNNNIKPDIRCPVVFHGLSEPHVSLTGYLDDTARYSRLTYECPGSPYEECLSSYAHSLNSGLYSFSGTPGVAINSIDADTGTGYKFNKSDNAVVIAYGDVGADGFQSISITTTSSAQTVEMFNPTLFVAMPFRSRLYSAISVNIAGLTSGDVKINTRIASYLSDKTTGLLTSSGTQSGIVGQWSVSGTPLTQSDFLGIQTFIENGYQSQLSHLSRPAILLTGWVGTIDIKLPAFWVQRGFGLGTPA